MTTYILIFAVLCLIATNTGILVYVLIMNKRMYIYGLAIIELYRIIAPLSKFTETNSKHILQLFGKNIEEEIKKGKHTLN